MPQKNHHPPTIFYFHKETREIIYSYKKSRPFGLLFYVCVDFDARLVVGFLYFEHGDVDELY